MKQVLDEIQSGVFAEEWVAEAHSGRENFYALEEKGRQHRIEQVGSKLRDMMPWISAGKVSVQDASGGQG
jgi:ketol-acid reductoisomerase